MAKGLKCTKPSSRLIAAPSCISSTRSVLRPAVAQTLEEVIVVATKREQGVMDVPLAITACLVSLLQRHEP
jgi:hypothetical protein